MPTRQDKLATAQRLTGACTTEGPIRYSRNASHTPVMGLQFRATPSKAQPDQCAHREAPTISCPEMIDPAQLKLHSGRTQGLFDCGVEALAFLKLYVGTQRESAQCLKSIYPLPLQRINHN
eukprot:625702-Amphidinium_carterae.1